MRNIKIYQFIGYLLVFLTVLSSCELDDGLEGNGNVTTQRQSVQEFTNLNIDGVLNVYFIQGESFKAEVRTDENLHGIVHFVNEGETLKVYTNTDEEYEATEMDVFITAPTVSNIGLNGVTALYIQTPIRQNSLTIDKQNTGYMLLTGALKYLTIHADGIGDMDLVGKSENMILVNDMIGTINAFDFSVDYLTLSHGGTGIVEINVGAKLDIEMHGIGDVYCKGNPLEVNKTGKGIGRLYMVED